LRESNDATSLSSRWKSKVDLNDRNYRSELESLIARIARLDDLKNSLCGHFVHAGAGCSTHQNGLVWREIDTAFQSHILTGAVINYNHIEPCQFLKDAKDIVLEQVQDIMKKHYNVKVNTIFNGEFVTGDKRANKSIEIGMFDSDSIH